MTATADSQAETIALIVRWQTQQDRTALETVCEHHLPIAYALARRYRGAWEPGEDVRQVAALGLIKAVNGYDTQRGTSFRAYAASSILGEIKRYFRDCGWGAHVPRGDKELALRASVAEQTLEARGEVPSSDRIAAEMGTSVEQATVGLSAAGARFTRSYDARPSDDDVAPAVDNWMASIEAGYDHVESVDLLEQIMAVLSEADREIVQLRFAEDLTQAEIAGRLGVSQMHISRVLRRSLRRMTSTVERQRLNHDGAG